MGPSRRKGTSRAAAAAAARRQWKVGDLVLAKVKGFPAWPATVSEPEKWGYAADMKKVLVYFFGTQQIAFCNPADVEAFTEEKKESLLVKRHGKGADFVRAVHEIIESYEKLKKEDQVNNCNSTNEQSLISENNNTESLTKCFSKDEAPSKTSQSFRRKTYSSAAQDVNAKPEDAAAVIEDDLQDIEILSKEVSSGSRAAETSILNTYLTRGSQAQKTSMQRRPPSTRQTRSSSRIDANKLQSLVTTSGSYAKNAVRDGDSVLREGSARRNKRLRKSPDADRHEVDSPDLVSNCSIEGDDSEILTADSDTLSLNEGSTVESDCKTILPDSVSELCQLDVELSQRLEFQTNAVINKKKRKPSRKRSTNDASEFAVKSDEKIASDSDIAKIEHNMPSDHEKSTERYSRDDGDEHLPLVKRARVRMGRASPIGEGPETSQDAEEKPPEGSNCISELVHGSSNKEGDGFVDQSSSLAKEKTDSSSPENRCRARPQLWEVRKNQFVGSLDGEAALPPSKRLHRALEAMSANAAEDSQAFSEEPSKMKPESIGYCSPSAGFSKLSMEKNSSEFLVSKAEENNNASKDYCISDYSAVPELPVPVGKIPSAKVEASTSCGCSEQEHMLESSDHKHHLESSCNVISDTVVEISSPNLPSANNCEQDAIINCNNGSQDLMMPPEDCNTGRLELVKHTAKSDHEVSHLDSKHVLESNDAIHSPNNATSMCMDCADDRGNETSKLCQLLQVESQEPAMFRGIVETGQTERGSSATPSSAPVEGLNVSHGNQNLHSDSASDGQSGDKAVSITLSSSSLTDGLDSTARATPHTSTCNASASDNVSIQINGSCSPAVQSQSSVLRTAANWNSKETDNALASFEASLRTLTRTKESIGRATRVAIDCAKYGVAAKVVEILARSLEHESNLHRRVDLFFLVDSVAQCSKGLKGEVGGIYPSAILAVLPRLLSAAAPPGSSSQENRRQCLKVLRVWQDRRILPESIIRHHIRELDSLCSSSCSRAFSRRPLRNERSFDDPIREMEGMLVDEYGSNSSIQLPGFRMPPMLRDEDDGIDSDGENFEAVTPEHNADKPEGESMLIPVVEKHRHILEDVDGELEMEDVAPSSEAVASTSNLMGTENQTFHHPPDNTAVVSFAPPLPQDVPPRSPPLPSSPPPLPPPPGSFPLHPEGHDSISNGPKSKAHTFSQNMEDSLQKSTRKQLIAPGVNSSVSDSIHYSAQGNDDFHPQYSKQALNSSNSCSFNSPPISNPVVRAVNNIPSADGAFNKGFRLQPPHPAPSNQFSYVQADQRVQSHRDIPPPSLPNRFHVPNAENGNFYRDCDRMKLAPHDFGEHWRTPPFPGPRYPDGSGMHYAPPPYVGQLREPAFPNQRLNFQARAMNHRELMSYRPPTGGPIPVAARGHNFWRPR